MPAVSSPPQADLVHDDLDNVFGPGKSFSSQQSKPQASGANDPFALFGGLGTTEQHRSVSQPPSAEDDLLGGLSSRLGASSKSTLQHSELHLNRVLPGMHCGGQTKFMH